MAKTGKRRLAQLLADRAGIPAARAAEFLDHCFAVICDELADGNSVTVPGFGTWSLKVLAARTGRDPRDGSEVAIPARTRVGFKVGAELHRRAEATIESTLTFDEERAPTGGLLAAPEEAELLAALTQVAGRDWAPRVTAAATPAVAPVPRSPACS